jgi:hypothetical protein
MRLYDDWPYDFLRGPVIDKHNSASEKPAQKNGAKGLVVWRKVRRLWNSAIGKLVVRLFISG